MNNLLLNRQTGTWKWGLLCLVFLAPFFFLSYGFANQYASTLAYVPSIVFGWEHHIPLWAWTIVPYWSIDLFYGLSLLLCWNTFELRQHVLRLFTAQLISIICFLIYPLKFSLERTELTGFFGLWFDVLMGFDKPFNQAPSLHIVLLVILWDFYRRHISGSYRWMVHVWSFLIGISVLTTWQHHFIDIPTGLIVGAVCLWLFPLTVQAPYQKEKIQLRTVKHIKLGSFYLMAGCIFLGIAILFKGWVLWLLYPVLSLILVAIAYLSVRPHFFQKQHNGQMTVAAWILFAPYFVMMWLNSLLWTYKHPEDSLVIQQQQLQIYLGRVPSSTDIYKFQGLFDCCAELPVFNQNLDAYRQYATVDLIPLQSQQLVIAVSRLNELVDQLRVNGSEQKILIFCGLGYSRSCSVCIAWLLQQGHVNTVEEAIIQIKKVRPWIVLKPAHIVEIKKYQSMLLTQEAES